VVVRLRWRAGGQDAQAAGHAQVEDQGAVAEAQQKVLGAPLHRVEPMAPQDRIQIVWHRPAQPWLAHRHAADALAAERRFDAAAGGFDLGQFGHGVSPAAGGATAARR